MGINYAANKKLRKSYYNRDFAQRDPNVITLLDEGDGTTPGNFHPQPQALITEFYDPLEEHPEEPEVACLQDQLRLYDWDRDVLPLLDLMPPRSADIIELRRKGLREHAIGAIFDLSQCAISYLILRAYQRLNFLLKRPKFTPEELRSLFESVPLPEIEVGLMIRLWANPAQTGAIDGVEFKTQGRVRHRFLGALRKMYRVLTKRPELVPIYNHYRWVQDEKLYNIMIEFDRSDRPKLSYRGAPGKPLSKRALHDKFKEAHGCTPTEYATKLLNQEGPIPTKAAINARLKTELGKIQKGLQPSQPSG